MTSDEVRNIAGVPSSDGRGLKSLDRWEITRNGVELHLDVHHNGDTDGSAVISRVVRFKHLLLSGAPDFDKHVDPPWP